MFNGKYRKIIAVLSSLVTLILTAVPFLIALVIKIKELIKEKNWQKVLSELGKLIVDAEKFTALSGIEKKNYVLESLQNFAKENKIEFDDKKIGETIDRLISFTKQVNVGKK